MVVDTSIGVVEVKPRGHSPEDWLRTHGTPLGVIVNDRVADLWDAVPKDCLPVVLFKYPGLAWIALVAYTKDIFYTYRYEQPELPKEFYYVPTVKLFRISNLKEVVDLMDTERAQEEKLRGPARITAELLEDVAKSLNRTKTMKQIAEEHGVNYSSVSYAAKKLFDLGVKIPPTKKGNMFEVFVNKLRQERSDLVFPAPKQQENGNGKQHKKR